MGPSYLLCSGQAANTEKMKRFFALALVLVMVVAAGCGSDSDGDEVIGIVVTEADTTAQIAVTAGEQFEVRLESNPSTGFRWEIAAMSMPRLVELVSRGFVDEADDDVVGAAGTEVFVFEVADSGAGILGLEYIRSFDDPPVPERIVEYIVRIDGAVWPPERDDSQPPLATATAPDSDGDGDGDVAEVRAFLDAGIQDVTAAGFVVWESRGARLCEVLAESFPPQCGGPWVVIANPERLSIDLESEGQVQWSQGRVEIAGRYDGDRFIIDYPDPAVEPTEADKATAQALADFASSPDGEAILQLPLATEVALGLGPDIDRAVAATALADPQNWVIDRQEFRAWSGPFSVLDLIGEPVTLSVGAHARCVDPPEEPPPGFETLRRVSLQPANATSCLEWWSLDLFVDPGTGQVSAITLDLYAP